MAKKQTLGRGFDALIPKDLDRSILEEDKNRVQKLLIRDIVPNPDQPRGDIDKSALDELTQSVKRHGVLQPIIVVSKKGQKGYQIVAGERRWRAASAAQMESIPAIVRSLEELEQIEIALIENIQRVDLSPLEQALSVFKLQQQFNMTLDEIAQKLGKATSTVSNLTRLLGLPDAAREALRQGKITEGHARAILSLKGMDAKQAQLLRCILDNNWSVRRAEQFASEAKEAIEGSKVSKNKTQHSEINELESTIASKIGATVKIKGSTERGQLIIPFKSKQELRQIIDKFN